MQYRKFGRADWSVSDISFGAWQIGGQWGAVDDQASITALLASYEGGVNLVDTAQMYGDGRSETLVGQSLRKWHGDQIRVATKIPPLSWPDADETGLELNLFYPDQYLRDQVDESLIRLQLDRIDLLQLHCWVPSGLSDLRWLETLKELRQAGKLDRIGVSLRDYRPDEGIELARSGLVDSIQVIYNIFEQRPEQDLFPAAAQAGTAIIARVVLDSGALSGAWTKHSYNSWEEGSVLHYMFRGGRFEETLERVTQLTELTSDYFDTLAEAAIRFALSPPAVTTAVIGMTRPKRIAENLAFSDGSPFPKTLRGQLSDHEWRRNFYL